MPFYYDNYDNFHNHCIATEIKFAWIPIRCHFTNRWLWLEYCYRQTAMWTGPGDHIFEERWYDKKKFLVNKIKGVV